MVSIRQGWGGVHAVDPEQPVSAVRTMEDVIELQVTDRRQELTRQIILRPHMGIQRAVLDEQRNNRLVVGHFARVVHHVTVVSGQVGPRFDE